MQLKIEYRKGLVEEQTIIQAQKKNTKSFNFQIGISFRTFEPFYAVVSFDENT